VILLKVANGTVITSSAAYKETKPRKQMKTILLKFMFTPGYKRGDL
jgi:hypothetical protein